LTRLLLFGDGWRWPITAAGEEYEGASRGRDEEPVEGSGDVLDDVCPWASSLMNLLSNTGLSSGISSMSDRAGELLPPTACPAVELPPVFGAYLNGVEGLSRSILLKSLLELLPWSRWMSLLKRDSLPEPDPPDEASESVDAAGCGGVDDMVCYLRCGSLLH